MNIQLKRIYEAGSKDDGYRILVDRLWPRGFTKEKAALDLWLKEIAPSNELRKWFGHDPDKWKEFQKKYRQELKQNKEESFKKFFDNSKLPRYLIQLQTKQSSIIVVKFLSIRYLSELPFASHQSYNSKD
jgi:uncharacterized protein YeaO (DUF488 family)